MLSIAMSEFRATMNAVLQKVREGEIVSITLRGTEIARLVPPDFARAVARQELERLRQTAIVGDALSPIDEPWEAAQ